MHASWADMESVIAVVGAFPSRKSFANTKEDFQMAENMLILGSRKGVQQVGLTILGDKHSFGLDG